MTRVALVSIELAYAFMLQCKNAKCTHLIRAIRIANVIKLTQAMQNKFTLAPIGITS